MDDLQYSILHVTRHSEKPIQKQDIYAAIEARDRLPVDHVSRSTVRETIDELHSEGLLCSLIFMPDAQELAIGFELTSKGQQRLQDLDDGL
jgi:hypothetical protein